MHGGQAELSLFHAVCDKVERRINVANFDTSQCCQRSEENREHGPNMGTELAIIMKQLVPLKDFLEVLANHAEKRAQNMTTGTRHRSFKENSREAHSWFRPWLFVRCRGNSWVDLQRNATLLKRDGSVRPKGRSVRFL